MAIQNDNWVSMNLNELVSIRSSLLEEELEEEDVDMIASDLRRNLTWDTMYGMIDDAILDHVGKLETHYGEIQPEPGREEYLNQIEKNKKQFEMVDLHGGSWTIQVPVRKKK